MKKKQQNFFWICCFFVIFVYRFYVVRYTCSHHVGWRCYV